MSIKPDVNYLLRLLLELLNGSLVDDSALVDKMSGGGGLAGVDMANCRLVLTLKILKENINYSTFALTGFVLPRT